MFLIGSYLCCRAAATANADRRHCSRRGALRMIPAAPRWRHEVVATRGERVNLTGKAMSRRFNVNPMVKAAISGPIVAIGYALAVFGIRYIGCLPRFADTDFADIPVTEFLLIAVTAAALFLTVFAAIGGFRQYRQARTTRGEAGQRTRRWGLIGIGSAVLSFVAVGWLAGNSLGVNCF